MHSLDPVRLITAKRDGGTLAGSDIRRLIRAYTDGDLPDYQMSAFLMAAFLRGMDAEEAFAFTDAMLHSGTIVDLSDVPGTKVDKHSTGGVGDKISLVLAPLVAAAGVPVPMISGRGLGHTGGTLDKLESIPGLRTSMDLDRYRRQLREVGVVMIGQTEDIAPADRKLYALRDVTATVESIPFIASSIMSKKLAEGIDALVLDVKTGRGAFMRDRDDARRLAETLAGIGRQFGTETVAVLTDMDEPLGYTVGNWPEVVESIRCLRGEYIPDVTDLAVALGAEMLLLAGSASSLEDGRTQLRSLLESGEAFETFCRLVDAQDGDVEVIRHPERRGASEATVDVVASETQNGYVASIDALAIGQAATRLGAGRLKVDDEVYPLAGITLCRRRGDAVQPGDTLARLHTRSSDHAEPFVTIVREAFATGEERPAPRSVVIDRLVAEEWGASA